MKKLAVVIFGSIAAMPAPAASAAAADTPGLDPNEVICRTVTVTGSRLGASRRCATRAQWIEDDRAQRAQLAERQIRQTQPTCMNPAERMGLAGRYVAAPINGGGVQLGCQ